MRYSCRSVIPEGLFLILLLLLQTGVGQAQNLSYSGSIQYATGSYIFEDVTESFSVTNGFGWTGELFSASFNVPFIVQSSPWITYGGTGLLPTGGPEHQTVRDSSHHGTGNGGMGSGMNSGQMGMNTTQSSHSVTLPDTASFTRSSFGDPNIYLNAKLWASTTGASFLQLNTGMKIPFADPNRGFGTGEWDFGAGLSVAQRLEDYFLMASVMKWWLGEMADLQLQDPVTYSVSAGLTFGDGKWMVNTTFAGYTEVIEGYDPPMRIGFGVGHFLSEKISLNGTAFRGLTESAADLSLGFGWNVKL